MSPVAEEALREKAAMGDLSLAQVLHYANIALLYAQEATRNRDFEEAARHAQFATDLLRTRGGK
jgi:hypothetical protein